MYLSPRGLYNHVFVLSNCGGVVPKVCVESCVPFLPSACSAEIASDLFSANELLIAST